MGSENSSRFIATISHSMLKRQNHKKLVLPACGLWANSPQRNFIEALPGSREHRLSQHLGLRHVSLHFSGFLAAPFQALDMERKTENPNS